jgi:mannose-6-phosphate isomerase-like protein (cupin superfamily)
MHHPILVGNMSFTFIKSRHETGGSLDLYELTIPPHVGLNLMHFHRDYDETVIGMNGIVTWTLNDRTVQIGPGQQLHVPRGVPHTFANLHACPARMMCILTPGLLGPEYFRELSAVVTTDGPPDLAAISSVMARYGVIPASM